MDRAFGKIKSNRCFKPTFSTRTTFDSSQYIRLIRLLPFQELHAGHYRDELHLVLLNQSKTGCVSPSAAFTLFLKYITQADNYSLVTDIIQSPTKTLLLDGPLNLFKLDCRSIVLQFRLSGIAVTRNNPWELSHSK